MTYPIIKVNNTVVQQDNDGLYDLNHVWSLSAWKGRYNKRAYEMMGRNRKTNQELGFHPQVVIRHRMYKTRHSFYANDLGILQYILFLNNGKRSLMYDDVAKQLTDGSRPSLTEQRPLPLKKGATNTELLVEIRDMLRTIVEAL